MNAEARSSRTAHPEESPAPVFSVKPETRPGDDFRLLGLSRIPRCADCAVLRRLVQAFEAAVATGLPWPAAPGNCRERVCAPLVRRFSARSEPRRPPAFD